jgi:amidase
METPPPTSRDDRPRAVAAAADDAIGTSDAADLLARLRRREVSAEELAAAARARIAAVEPALNAVVMPVHANPVRADAQAPLAGIPTVLKDNEYLAGYPSTQGSWAVPDTPADHTSPFLEQYLGLGLVPLAKTTMPEFGLTATTESPRYGATRNPWDTGRSVGGSSGGSAALVAAGAVPIGHANDGGGSIRIPAACCGLVGLKPSRGRFRERREVEQLPVPLVTQGVVTRTVRDTALFFAAAEQAWRAPGLEPVGDVRGPAARRLRIALVTTGLRGMPVAPEASAAVLAAGRVCAGLGHEVEEVPYPYAEHFAMDFLRYWALLGWSIQRFGARLYGSGFDPTRTTVFTNGLAQFAGQQLERIPGSIRRLRRMAAAERDLERRYDVLLAPVLGSAAPPIGYLGWDQPFRKQLVRLIRFTTITPGQNVSGAPAISLPLGRSADGSLPIGVQFSAPLGGERMLLELAYELEAAQPFAMLGG